MATGLVLNDRFRLIEELGRGGMGSVWRAFDLALEADAAVKLIDPSLLQTPEALARFKREAKAAASIRSTHVVQILEYGVEEQSGADPMPYIAMELLKGETLSQRLTRVGHLSPAEALPILTHVARALSLAHKHGIVHRDLKPDNVFLVREMDDVVGKVLDFGVARQLGGLARTGGIETQSGAVLGTPYYMSPEQTIGQPVDPRSDIWSFGVIAFECLTGVRPFEHETLGGLFHAICVAEMPVPSARGNVPEGFDAWFKRATERDPAMRFPNIEEASAELRKVCGHGSLRPLSSASMMQSRAVVAARSAAFGVTPPPSSQTIPGLPERRPWLKWAMALTAVGVACTAGYFGLRSHESQSPVAATAATSSALPTAPPPPYAAQPGPTPIAAPPSESAKAAPEVVPIAASSMAPAGASTSVASRAQPLVAPRLRSNAGKDAINTPAPKGKQAATQESPPLPVLKPPPELTHTPEAKPPAPAAPTPAPSPAKKKENVAGF